jgi:formylglycine-generating enzyme required for sulfatase activity
MKEVIKNTLCFCSLVSSLLCLHGNAYAKKKSYPAKPTLNKTTFASTFDEIKRSLQLAVISIDKQYTEKYPGQKYLEELNQVKNGDLESLKKLQRRALLANPTLDFDSIIAIERIFGKKAKWLMGRHVGLAPGNFNSLAKSKREGYKGGLVEIKAIFQDQAKIHKLHEPKHGGLLTDVDLHFDAERVIFAMARPGDFVYRLFELDLKTKKMKQVDPDDGVDVDHFDPCYTPDDQIIFASTATFLGMPCINGGPRMASLYTLNPTTKSVRQLGFDQDTSWYPAVANDGRIMYTRWDYSDMVHSNNRPVMIMNPDGSGQKSINFSNSYFPASYFFARPIPGHPSKMVGVITGHHGVERAGRMIISDPAISTHEEKGMVQEIPGYGKKVKRKVADRLVDGDWPLILHPYPLAQSETNLGAGEFFLVSMKMEKNSPWGIYLVDIYDNAIPLMIDDQKGYFEPLPYKKSFRPPVIPSLIKPEEDTAVLYIQDVYHGPGLKDVPKGKVKSLRVGSYQFSAHGNGGHWGTIGLDSGWDIKTILGMVPVNEDGSVTVEIPSKTPLFFQPLDEQGRALQGMRSWATAQGGERMSCIGCHESSSDMPRPKLTAASQQTPKPLLPWLGPERPLSFRHEIQPILDAKCVSCHDAGPANGRYVSHRHEFQGAIPDLRNSPVTDYKIIRAGGTAHDTYGGRFSESYMALHALVRHPGIESPMHVLNPGEFGSIVSELSHMLKKGHFGVELSDEDWLALNTWMDYNAPYHGYRKDIIAGEGYQKESDIVHRSFKRGNELSQCYAGKDTFVHLDPPADPITEMKPRPSQDIVHKKRQMGSMKVVFDTNSTSIKPMTLRLNQDHSITFQPIPSGSFTMGSNVGAMDELPMHVVKIEHPFWMASKEISNAQLRLYLKAHNSRFEDRVGYQFGQEGIPVNGDELPAVRVSWLDAQGFCTWLSQKTGKKVRLPTEAQWEWAARAGATGDFYFSGAKSRGSDIDFSQYANLADKSLELFAENSSAKQYTAIVPIQNPNRFEMYLPYVKKYNDGQRVQCQPGQYQPNSWGLYDMHGNVSEWTRSNYQVYPFKSSELDTSPSVEKVARGGSYRDRPYRATASHRLPYEAWQKVHDVGFRIIVEMD